jgi:hypothetical protein
LTRRRRICSCASSSHVTEGLSLQRHGALPHGLRQRRGVGRGDRHSRRLRQLRHDSSGDRTRVLLQLRSDGAATAQVWAQPRAVLPLAFASDTISITVMEIVDNRIILAVPGAMEAGLASLLFWGAWRSRWRSPSWRPSRSTGTSSQAARAMRWCTSTTVVATSKTRTETYKPSRGRFSGVRVYRVLGSRRFTATSLGCV